jgi:hypothetical protein
MLDDGVGAELRQDFGSGSGGEITRNEHKMQTTFASMQRLPAHEEQARAQYEREQALNSTGGWFRLHARRLSAIPCRPKLESDPASYSPRSFLSVSRALASREVSAPGTTNSRRIISNHSQ